MPYELCHVVLVFTECELCLTVICYVLFLAVQFITVQYELFWQFDLLLLISGSIVCVSVQYGLCLAVSFNTVQYQYDLFWVMPFITVLGGGLETKSKKEKRNKNSSKKQEGAPPDAITRWCHLFPCHMSYFWQRHLILCNMSYFL